MRPKQDMYDGAIAYLDSEVGWLLRELERRGQLENTIVIITSDHGEEFAEHGLIDHGNSLYRHSLWVPLVVWFPGHVPEGQRVLAPVSLRNLAATIMDLAVPGTAPLPGRSLARFWTATDAAPDTIVASVRQTDNLPAWFPVTQHDLFSIAFNGWRYIRTEEDSTEELYDFEHDVLERWNLVESDFGQRVLPQYRGALAALRAATRPPQLSGK
jgi:arylsulfatase A-like enzyme